ncbi:MAG: hypothetical protein ACOVP4_01785 [Bacteriovoracaceae bacterium]
MGKIWHSLMVQIRMVFKGEDSKFLIFTGIKIMAISMVTFICSFYFLLQVLRLNFVFFESKGYPKLEILEQAWFESVIGESLENLVYIFFFHIFLFFIGIYVGHIILRPFRAIGEYCQKVIDQPNAVYKVDDFSTYRLLTHFSEFFFEYLRESRKRGVILANSIPPQYSGIHKPMPDRIFIFHFVFLLTIVSISSTVFIIETINSIYSNMIELALTTLKFDPSLTEFFTKQNFIYDQTVYITIGMTVILYSLLGMHLYSMVSGAAFGIFATMRSFMKGNYFSRVHLIGYSYIREHTRVLNKYLDYIQNNFDKEPPKG